MMAAAVGCGWVVAVLVAVTWSNDDDDIAEVLCECCCCAGCSMIPAADALEAGRGLNRTEEEMADAIASVERVLCRTGTSMVAGGSAVLFGGFEIFAGIYCVMSTSWMDRVPPLHGRAEWHLLDLLTAQCTQCAPTT